MKLNITNLSTKSPAQVQVWFTSSKEGKDKKSTAQIVGNKASTEMKTLLSSIDTARFSGGEGESVFIRREISPHVLFVGVGEDKNLSKRLTAENFRRMSAGIYKTLQAEKISSAQICAVAAFSAEAVAIGLTEGLILTSYQFETYKEEPKNKHVLQSVDIAVEKFSSSLNKLREQSEIIAQEMNFARWLGDCPGNFMTPSQLAEEAQKRAKGTKIKVTIWDKARIAKEKMDSFLSVSEGSSQDPRFIIMEYSGGNAKQKPLCLVGKGLTFDCGGISIKPSAGMEEMKFDMCGGATVIASMVAMAKLGLKINVKAYVPATENLAGPAANKPGDIRRARNGKTIEINNTDAEGRLILADALVYACEQKPGMILDVATLTGAMMVALGNTHTGFFTHDAGLRKKIETAAEDCGEKVWAMPMTEDHAKDMKGYYADLTNLAPSRNAGSATAAAFLGYFVEKGIPWAHFDIAGTGWNVSNRLPYISTKGAAGTMVRTFVEVAKNYRG